MDIVARSADSVKRLWGSLNGPQRFVLALSFVLMIGLLMWGSGAAAGDSWQKVAGHEVADAERAEILKTLAKKQVPHKVSEGQILVRRDQADKVVLELAGEGLLTEKAMWAWLESSDVFATKWDKEKRYQIALQRKLEYMIRKVEGVLSVGVQISQASEAQQIGFQGSKASASVQVELRPGATLSYVNVRAIAGVVAHAVPGLDPDRVHLMDTRGRAYRIPKVDEFAAGAGDLREIEARLEAEIKTKIAELFESARIVVRAFARSKGERSEKLQHGKAHDVKDSSRSLIKEPPARIKGEGEAEQGRTVERQEDITRVVDTTKTQSFDPAGVIERVTVGILLPMPVDANGKPVGKTPPLEEVRKLAMMASGAKLEDVSVVALETRAPEPLATVPPAERTLEWFFENWTKIALAVLGLFALVVVAWAIRGGMPKGEVEEIRAIASRLGEPLQAVADPLRPAEGDVAALRRGIQEAVDRDPEEAASALKAWVAGR